jgi:hypothetical protein
MMMTVILTVLIVTLTIFSLVVPNVNGESSFVNQQYLDQVNDWELIKSPTGTFSIPSPDGKITKLPSEINREKCDIDVYPDIKGVSYNSDGETIHATLWVNPITIDQNASSYIGVQNKWISEGYHMSIDIPSVYDYGNDYVYRLEWNPQSQTWSDILEERNIGVGGKNKIHGPIGGAGAFLDSNSNYVTFSINRSTLSLPDNFKIVFSTWGAFQNDERNWCVVIDTTNFIDIPPPKFNLSLSDHPPSIRKGETITIPLHITSDSGSNSLARLRAVYDNKSIALNIIPENVNIPPYSEADSLLEIKALDSRYPAPVLINASISFPSSPKLQSGAIIHTASINNISDEVRFTLGILPELGLYDYVNNTLSTWGAAASQTIALVAGLGGAVTAVTLIISKLRRREQDQPKDKEENNQT